jgi:hypothetical protein
VLHVVPQRAQASFEQAGHGGRRAVQTFSDRRKFAIFEIMQSDGISASSLK